MIGDTLRRERERQELTVQDVEQGTSIRSIYIEALENGEYDRLPGEVYAKGFVKNYANFLNLNGEALSKEFAAELAPAPVVETVAEGGAVVEEKVVPEIPKNAKPKITELKEPNMKVRKSRGGSGSNNLLIIAAVVLIAVLAGGFWYYMKNSPETVANVEPPKQTEVTPPAENPVSAAIPQDGVNIQARYNGDCWTRVFVDGAYVYEGVPSAGQVLDWHGAESVTVRVGNASAIEISMNGQNLGALGALGEVVERTFTRQAVNY